MDNNIRILIVEDNKSDAELVERELQRGNLSFESRCVETKESFLKELKGFSPDVILCDYKMPAFDAMAALDLTRKNSPSTPLIVVTGSISEEIAVECIKAGATDYIIKDRLTRITPAVTKALERQKADQERLAALEALKRSEQKYKAIFNLSPEVIAMVDKNGTIIDINRRVEDYIGYLPHEIIGLNLREPPVFTDEGRNLILRNFIRALQGEKVAPYEVEVIAKDGRRLSTNLYTDVIKESSGELAGVIAIFFDITEQKAHEKNLRMERDRARMYFDTAGTIFLVLDRDQRISMINRKGCEILGYKKEDMVGKVWSEHFIPVEHREEVSAIWKNMMAGNISIFEKVKSTILTKNREQRIIMWNNVLLKDDEGKIFGTLSSGHDITDMENALHDVTKTLAALKEFKDLTVGRENRMIELKREINKLAGELGRPKPYDISFSE